MVRPASKSWHHHAVYDHDAISKTRGANMWSSGLPYTADIPGLASSYSMLHASATQGVGVVQVHTRYQPDCICWSLFYGPSQPAASRVT